jgi:hypothetical protein
MAAYYWAAKAREVLQHNAASRRKQGLISEEWARTLIRRGIYVGGAFATLSALHGLSEPAAPKHR